MKKNIISIAMILVLCIFLCSCGGNESNSAKASITDNDGNVVSLSASELGEVFAENAAAFYSKYQGAEATITGTVENVEAFYKEFATDTKPVYEINLQEGWVITVLKNPHDEVIDLSKGDKITVTSKLQYCADDTAYMMYIGRHIGKKTGWYDDTIIEIAS